MLGLPLASWIRGLGPDEAVALARDLAFAEAAALRLPPRSVEMSLQITLKDAGIDGRTEFPEAAGNDPFPGGRNVWQIKSGTTSPSATTELTKSGVLDAFADGFDYVLFWTNDPADPTRANIRSAFEE